MNLNDIANKCTLLCMSIGLNFRKHVSNVFILSPCFDAWWNALTSLNRSDDFSIDDLNNARQSMALFCYTASMDHHSFTELRILTEPLHYDLPEPSTDDGEITEIPDFDTSLQEGESDEDRYRRLDKLYLEHIQERYDNLKDQSQDENEQFVVEWEEFSNVLQNIYDVLCKITKSTSKPSSKVLMWFYKMSNDNDSTSFSKTLANIAFMRYHELIASKTWAVDSLYKDLVFRINTQEMREYDIDSESEEVITQAIKSFKQT